MLESIIELAATGLAVHITPNVIMKTVKSTKFGHKLLTGTLSAGVELGRKNRKISMFLHDIIKYGVGPEALVEYYLGLKIGKKISSMNPVFQEAFLKSFKEGIIEELENKTPEEVAQLKATPVINAMINYAEGESSEVVETMLVKASTEESTKRGFKNHLANAAILGGVALTQPHALLQPVISFIRATVAKTEYSKNLLRKNYEKGANGEMMSKPAMLATDLLVSPAVLDTMRIGNTAKASGMTSVIEELMA